MSYTLVKDSDFTAAPANTAVGAGASSTTGIGDGWKDFVGNLWHLSNTLAPRMAVDGDVNAPAGDPPVGSALYYDNGASSFLNGKSRVHTKLSSTSSDGNIPCAMARFTTAAGGSGYAAGIYNARTAPQLFVFKAINGVVTRLVNGDALGVTPNADYIVEIVPHDDSPTQTTLTINFYYRSAPAVAIASVNVVDTDATTPTPIQTAGFWGAASYSQAFVEEIEVFQETAGPLAAGALASVATYKTVLKANSAAATGGDATKSYQWYGSVTPGFTPGAGNIIGGATALALRWPGRTPGVTYYLKVVVTDGLGATDTSGQLAVTMLGAAALVVVDCGDSLSADGRAQAAEIAALAAAGVTAVIVNKALGGTLSGDWLTGGANHNAAAAAVVDVAADAVRIMIGTNDSGTPVAGATYRAHVLDFATGMLAAGAPLVLLKYPPYSTGAGRDQPSLLDYGSVELEALDNGATIRVMERQNYAFYLAHPDQLGPDGVHFTATGYTSEGGLWAGGLLAIIGPNAGDVWRVLAQPGGLTFVGGGVLAAQIGVVT